jgi:hypothetical protein
MDIGRILQWLPFSDLGREFMARPDPIPSPPEPEAPKPQYFAGLDLGQAQDFSALAVLERVKRPDPARPDREVNHYAVRELRRWPLGTSYTVICADVVSRYASGPLTDSTLAVDRTGVGAGVIDFVGKARPAAQLVPVLITAGHQVVPEGRGWHVPKRELVAVLQVLLQTRRLKVASSLREAETLTKELANFRVKVTVAGNETFEAWRERDHDDLVLAVGIAAWVAERGQRKLVIG